MIFEYLYACRYPFAPCNRKRQPWRLVWARPGSDTYVCAEGECSARYFETLSEARAYGERRYGETATRWVWGDDFPVPNRATRRALAALVSRGCIETNEHGQFRFTYPKGV